MKEFQSLRSQFVTSKRGSIRFLPYVFAEQGGAMPSSVIHSDRATRINSAIMRTFVCMRELARHHKQLEKKINELESNYNEQLRQVFETIKN